MSRELAILVLTPKWTVDQVLAIASPDQISDMVDRFNALPPLYLMETNHNGRWNQEIREWIKPIGMKAWPTMSDVAKREWLDAMVLALSDLPPSLAVAALKQAVHHCFRFHNEVEPWVRERADLIRRSINLLPYQAARASRPDQEKLEAPGTRWTEGDVADANRSFEACGIRTRYRLVGDQVETYQAELPVSEEE